MYGPRGAQQGHSAWGAGRTRRAAGRAPTNCHSRAMPRAQPPAAGGHADAVQIARQIARTLVPGLGPELKPELGCAGRRTAAPAGGRTGPPGMVTASGDGACAELGALVSRAGSTRDLGLPLYRWSCGRNLSRAPLTTFPFPLREGGRRPADSGAVGALTPTQGRHRHAHTASSGAGAPAPSSQPRRRLRHSAAPAAASGASASNPSKGIAVVSLFGC